MFGHTERRAGSPFDWFASATVALRSRTYSIGEIPNSFNKIFHENKARQPPTLGLTIEVVGRDLPLKSALLILSHDCNISCIDKTSFGTYHLGGRAGSALAAQLLSQRSWNPPDHLDGEQKNDCRQDIFFIKKRFGGGGIWWVKFDKKPSYLYNS
jgi:hypothetical protein